MSETKKYNITHNDTTRQKWNLGWQYLGEKQEYQSNKYERSFSSIILDNVSILATKLNLNSDLCEFLTIIKCSFFPAYGKAGFNAIQSFLKERNISISFIDLAIAYTKHDFSESGNSSYEVVIDLLPELFNDETTESSIKEIKLVKTCYKLIEKIKPIAFTDLTKFYEVEEQTFKRLTEQSIEKNEPTWLTEFDLLNVPTINEFLSSDDEEFYLNSIKESIDEDNFLYSLLDFILVGYLDIEEDEETE